MARRPVPTRAALLLGGCLALLCAAWAGANPVGGSPDEPSHFVKAYASGTGQIGGRPYPTDISLDNPLSTEWFQASGRSYRVPAEVVPPQSVQCFAFYPDRTPECQDLEPPAGNGDRTVLAPTNFGRYIPTLYFPSGLAAATADDFSSGSTRARWANTLLSIGFLAAAALVARRLGALTFAALAVATTPMVVFLSASINPNGIEAAAAVCMWMGVIRLLRLPEDPSPGPWWAVAISGATLALSRPLGAAVLVAVVLVAVLSGGPGVRRVLAGAMRRRSMLVGGVLAAAFASSAAWAVLVMPSPEVDPGLAARSLDEALRDLPNQARQLIGIFGWNDTTMPLAAYLLAFGVIGALGVVALRAATGRERLGLLGLVAVVLVADVGIAVLIEAQIGFGMQARYVLPLAVGFPLLAAEALARPGAGRGTPAWAAPGLLGAAAILHLVAFLANAHRYAVGRSGSWTPPWDSRWSPEGGLAPWLLLVLVATVGMLLVARWSRDAVPARTAANG